MDSRYLASGTLFVKKQVYYVWHVQKTQERLPRILQSLQ